MAASEAETASLKGEDAELKKFLEGEEEEDDQLQEYIKSMVRVFACPLQWAAAAALCRSRGAAR
jgi:hypothetical protein